MNPSSSLSEIIKLRQAGKFTEALRLLSTIINNDLFKTQDTSLYIKCLNEQSECLWRQGKYSEAELYAQEVINLTIDSEIYILGRSRAFYNLGEAYEGLGEREWAETYYKQSLEIAESQNDLEGMAKPLNSLAILYLARGELNLAEESFKQCYKLGKRNKDLSRMAKSLGNIGMIYHQRGDFERTTNFYLKSYELHEKNEYLPGSAAILNNIGELYRQRGDLLHAEEYITLSLPIYEKLGDNIGRGLSFGNLGYIHWQKGEFNIAKKYLEQSISLIKTIDPPNAAERMEWLVRVFLSEGSISDAQQIASEINELVKKTKLPVIEVRYQLALGRIHLNQFDIHSALKTISQAKTQAKIIPHFELLVDSLLLEIQIQLQLYLNSKQIGHRAQVQNLLQEIELVSKREQIHNSYIEVLILQALLKRSTFDLNGAIEKLEVAEILAKERSLNGLAQKAQNEKEQLLKQAEFLQKFMQQTPTNYEKAQMEQMLSYMRDAEQYVSNYSDN